MARSVGPGARRSLFGVAALAVVLARLARRRLRTAVAPQTRTFELRVGRGVWDGVIADLDAWADGAGVTLVDRAVDQGVLTVGLTLTAYGTPAALDEFGRAVAYLTSFGSSRSPC